MDGSCANNEQEVERSKLNMGCASLVVCLRARFPDTIRLIHGNK